MIDRRDMMKRGAGLPIALAPFPLARVVLAKGDPASGAPPSRIDLWIVDNAFAKQAEALRPMQVIQIQIDGDVTALWRDTLDPLWHQRGTCLAGVTEAKALFVLEQLAWSRGRRVIERHRLAPSEPETHRRPIYWRITPHHPSARTPA